MQIILASQSPRRQELLAAMGVEFTTVPSDYDEQLDDARTPEEVSIELGLGKAMRVAEAYPEALVIGSDTIVTVDGHQLGKAADETEAREMLRMLAGRASTVTTSLAVVCLAQDMRHTTAETAKIFFRPYDELLVDAYIATGDYRDKAGAYGIQSGAHRLIARIEGNYDAIVGLPTQPLAVVLLDLGIKAHPAQLTPPVFGA